VATQLDLRKVPTIDVHCFPYVDMPMSRDDTDKMFALGGIIVGSVDTAKHQAAVRHLAENTVTFRAFVKEWARFLDCAQNIEAVIEAREARRKTDFTGYVRAMCQEVGLKTIIADNGTKTMEQVDEFGKRFPGAYKKTFRLETMVRDLLKTEKLFSSLVAKFDEGMERAVKVHGCVSFKTVIAYRTGLDIQKVSEAEAERDFAARNDDVRWFGPHAKKLRDFLMRRALIKSIGLKVPILIHTGLGDTDIVAAKCNAALLTDILKDEEVLPAKVVLIHGGFPYTLEAGWLANVLPNVYVELSCGLVPYMEPAMSAERYGHLLQWVPLPKLIFGSDAGDWPEFHWYYPLYAKRSMGKALGTLVDAGIFTQDQAMKEAENIFHNNAKKLFGL